MAAASNYRLPRRRSPHARYDGRPDQAETLLRSRRAAVPICASAPALLPVRSPVRATNLITGLCHNAKTC
jgi:hypothetical protein